MKINDKNKGQRRFLIFIVLAVMAVGMMLISASVYANEESRQESKLIIIGTELDYPPYSFLNEEGEPTGFNVELTRAIAEVMELEVKIKIEPWGEIRKALETGKIDAISGMYHSEERDKLADFSPPCVIISHAIFARPDSPAIESEDELRGKDIIVMQGDIMHDYVLKNNISQNPVLVNTPAEALRLLASGQNDYALTAKLPGLYWVKKLKLTNLATVGPLLRPSEYCYAVREGNAELLGRLNEGLAILKETDRYKVIYNKWLGVLEPKGISMEVILKYAAIVLIPLLLLLAGIGFWTWALRKQVALRTEKLEKEITERKQAEEVLRQSEEKYRGIFDESIAAIYLFDAQKNFIDSNQAGLDLLGYIRKELLKMSIPDVDADTEAVLPAHKKLLAGDRIVNYEHQLKRKDGSIITVLNNSRPLIDIDGNVVGMQSTLIDITERKQAEENMKKAKNELQMIMDSVPALIIYRDIEGRIIRANKTLADRLEIPVKDMVGKAIEELVPKEQAENIRKNDKEVIISGKSKRDIIQPYDTPKGTRWAIIDKMPYKDKEGKIIGVIAFAKDITVQRKSKQELQQSYQKLKKTMNATIDTMSKMIEAKDPYTSGHQRRVCQLAVPLAWELGLAEDKVEGIRIASLIHDIGKIGIPTETLSKPTKLTDIEFNLIKGHSQIGYDILKSIDFFYPIDQIVLQHHEKINGSGYPRGLKEDDILLEAKIICVADVVEAMSSHRPYRPALGIDVALEEIIQNKGILYDSEVVDVCLKLFKEKGFKFK